MKPMLSIAAAAWVASAVLIVTPPALAQESKAPPVIAVKAARLFDGKSDALQANGVVLVQGPKILAVGTDLSIPAGAEVIDLGDATLSPGFIDAHTHLTGESTDDWKQGFVDGFRRELAEKAIESTVHARKVLEAGFTTVRDVGSERPARRGPAQRDRPRAGPRPADAGLGPRAGGPRRPRRRDRAAPRPADQGARAGRGDRPRAGRVPRGGPLPGQVRRRRDQVLRLGGRAVAGRRGGHAATDPRGDEGAGRRGPPAAQEGGRALPRRPRRPRGHRWPASTRSSTARSWARRPWR